jgi:hypothetical protein
MTDDAARTAIDLIVGADFKQPPLKIVRDAGFVHRTGVIQHTYRPDCVDSYFDKPLWLRLLRFAQSFGVVTIIDRPWGGPKAPNRDWQSGKAKQPAIADERPLEGFLECWDGEYPPELILAWSGSDLVLSIATEYWVQAGGPRPYADSFTYSICSDEDLSGRIRDFLLGSPDAGGWSISPELLLAHDSFE